MQTDDICSATERILKLRNYPRKQPYLLAAAEDLHAHFGFLPKEAIAIIENHFDQSLNLGHELSTLFHTHADASNAIRICAGPFCSKAGSHGITSALKATRGITIEESFCLGGCSQAPVAAINGEIIPKASISKLVNLLNSGNKPDRN